MTRPPPRYVGTTGPLLARATPRTPRPAAHAATLAAAHAARLQLGPPLRHRLRSARGAAAGPWLRAFGVLAAAVACFGLPAAAWFQAWGWLAAGGLLVGAWLGFRLRVRRDAAARAGELSAQDLEAFDRLLFGAAAGLRESHRHRLCGIKSLLVQLAVQHPDEDPARIEDRVHAGHCVRRRIPELLAAFLAIPPALRDEVQPGAGIHANQQLEDQLAVLQAGLLARLRRAGCEAADAFWQQ